MPRPPFRHPAVIPPSVSAVLRPCPLSPLRSPSSVFRPSRARSGPLSGPRVRFRGRVRARVVRGRVRAGAAPGGCARWGRESGVGRARGHSPIRHHPPGRERPCGPLRGRRVDSRRRAESGVRGWEHLRRGGNVMLAPCAPQNANRGARPCAPKREEGADRRSGPPPLRRVRSTRPDRACRGRARSPSGRSGARGRCRDRRRGPGRAHTHGRRSAGIVERSARP